MPFWESYAKVKHLIGCFGLYNKFGNLTFHLFAHKIKSELHILNEGLGKARGGLPAEAATVTTGQVSRTCFHPFQAKVKAPVCSIRTACRVVKQLWKAPPTLFHICYTTISGTFCDYYAPCVLLSPYLTIGPSHPSLGQLAFIQPSQCCLLEQVNMLLLSDVVGQYVVQTSSFSCITWPLEHTHQG